MDKKKDLADLHKKWTRACNCMLRNTATQAVPGQGSPKAKIVFIGEAPGKKEDELGLPFVGAAGKLLDEMLKEIKLDRSDIYITNVVKYRPPNNRDPKPQEKADCFPWLSDELNLIRPKLIVFLGRHAMSNFFPELGISEVHGKLQKKKVAGIPTQHFLPLYHPAAALYNTKLRATLMNDFKKIPLIMKKIKV